MPAFTILSLTTAAVGLIIVMAIAEWLDIRPGRLILRSVLFFALPIVLANLLLPAMPALLLRYAVIPFEEALKWRVAEGRPRRAEGLLLVSTFGLWELAITKAMLPTALPGLVWLEPGADLTFAFAVTLIPVVMHLLTAEIYALGRGKGWRHTLLPACIVHLALNSTRFLYGDGMVATPELVRILMMEWGMWILAVPAVALQMRSGKADARHPS
ncbi:MAG: hypothetical protein DI547_12975 [Sphingobium sp.]|nr:MAG: hypothetical protein DI547_12975 [Sphingobium sp.]